MKNKYKYYYANYHHLISLILINTHYKRTRSINRANNRKDSQLTREILFTRSPPSPFCSIKTNAIVQMETLCRIE